MSHTRKVGFIGLGLMGRPMAIRLAERGRLAAVWNRTAASAEGFESEMVAADPAELAGRAHCIACMVTDEGAVRDVLEHRGLLDALTPKHVLLNFSTVGPRAACALHELVCARGAAYVDVPVLGSIEPARRGELILFVGGESEAIEWSRPILESVGKSIYPLGPVGRGSQMKLIANMLLARYVEALGETLSLAESFQLSPAMVVSILQNSVLASPMWNKAQSLLRDDVALHFPLKHMAKDLRLLDEEVERCGLALPAHEAVHAVFQEALTAGMGESDYSTLANWIRRRS